MLTYLLASGKNEINFLKVSINVHTILYIPWKEMVLSIFEAPKMN